MKECIVILMEMKLQIVNLGDKENLQEIKWLSLMTLWKSRAGLTFTQNIR